MEEPFYKDGLCFECQRCSGCCRFDSGYVFLSHEDLEKLAAKLSLMNFWKNTVLKWT